MNTVSDNQVSKYDRRYGALIDTFIHTKPSTVKIHESVTGRSETFIIQTIRQDDCGDWTFIECIDESGTTRIALPPKVTNIVASHRESLTTRKRSITSKRVMKERIAAGEVLGFQRKKA